MISLASSIYPGECETIKFPNEDKVNFTLISNTSSFEGFNWNKDGYDITYCFPTYLAPGNYSFEWSNYQDSLTEPTEIIKEVTIYRGGGGGTRTIYKDKNVTEYITKYVDKDVIKYEDKEVERIVNKTPWVLWGFVVILLGFISYLVFFRKQDTDERRYKK